MSAVFLGGFATNSIAQNTSPLPSTGPVGLGTLTPGANLDIIGPAISNNQPLLLISDNSNIDGGYSHPTNLLIQPTDMLVEVRKDYTYQSGQFTGYAYESVFSINGSGQVGIGTNTPGSAYSLDVVGKIRGCEIVVEDPNGWCDYVFDDDYQLRSLAEVEAFIAKNHHLPDVPSEAEVMSEGINLGDMDAVLLKKVEELTLYVIELQKTNEALQSRIAKLEAE